MIADNIKKIRMAYGLSQDEFSKRLGVTRSVIANLEYDRLQHPEKKMPLFRLISKTFGIPIEWILADAPGDLPCPTERTDAPVTESISATAPIVNFFADFWNQRTDAEKNALRQAIAAFADYIKQQLAE